VPDEDEREAVERRLGVRDGGEGDRTALWIAVAGGAAAAAAASVAGLTLARARRRR
jgi:hypothetical protein